MAFKDGAPSPQAVCSAAELELRPGERRSWAAEARDQLRLATPICIAMLCNRYMATVAMVLVGRRGAREMAGVGLAVSLANVTGNSVMVGLAGSLQTIAGQAFGARNFAEVSLSLQRSLMICGLAFLPMAGLWLRIESLLLLLGQEPEVSAVAARYLVVLLPGMACFTVSQCLQNWLSAQRVTRPTGTGGMIVALLFLPLCWFLVHPARLGFLGAAVATSTANLFVMLWLALHVRHYVRGPLCSSWQGLSRRAFHDWCPFLRLAIPAFLMISEWWASEISVLLAGRLPQPEDSLDALSLMVVTVGFCFMPPASIGIVANTRVSNELGAGHPSAAARAAVVACGLGLAVVTACATTLVLWREAWARLFTSDEGVLEQARPVLLVSVFYVMLDGMCTVTSGSLKGCGRQLLLAPVVVASYYLAGLPSGMALAWWGRLGTLGLALGMMIGTGAHLASFTAFLATTRWPAMAHDARRRAGVGAAGFAPRGVLPPLLRSQEPGEAPTAGA